MMGTFVNDPAKNREIVAFLEQIKITGSNDGNAGKHKISIPVVPDELLGLHPPLKRIVVVVYMNAYKEGLGAYNRKRDNTAYSSSKDEQS